MPEPTSEFLLEIGCEEIPAPWLPGLIEQLQERFQEEATRAHLAPASAMAFATPRRLVVSAVVRARQEDQATQVWGPSLKVGRDAAGGWTGAALGFAKKNGVTPDELQHAAKDPAAPDDLYLLFVKRAEGRPAREVLQAVIGAVLRGLSFPKRMSWDAWLDDGKGSFPFGRPIRWMVALLDGQVVPFVIHAMQAGTRGDEIVRSGTHTYGHRFLPRGTSGRPIQVSSFADLKLRLRDAFVLLESAERQARISEGLASEQRDAAQSEPHGLLEEWRDLVEYPSVVFGRIPPEFAELPHEVLGTVLVHHQKYLPLGGAGSAGSRFAAITNSDASASDVIVRGMERVVVARLRDAAFFFAEDMKRPLAERVPDLAGVTFHQKLGTYREKAERMARLVDAMAGELALLTKAEHGVAREAALLSKADLTTLMVKEFPELQGVMGGIYLRAQGTAPPALALAVQWHYHPISSEEGSLPQGLLAGSDARVFGAVSLADKLDTLAGYFGVGLQPTGSSDPYGLRRAALGVIRVLLDFWTSTESLAQRPSLRRLAAAALAGYEGRLKRAVPDVAPDLEAFFLDRLRQVLLSRGYPGDEVEAVLGAREPDALDDPHECWVRLRALHRVRSEAREDFEHLAVAFKRAKNILGPQPTASVDPALFGESAERELHAAISGLANRNGDYEARLRSLATLRAPVDRFFDDVLVMAEAPAIRANRLGLLSQALSLFYRIADISKLGG